MLGEEYQWRVVDVVDLDQVEEYQQQEVGMISVSPLE